MVYGVQVATSEAPHVGTSAQFLTTFIRLQYQLDDHRFVLGGGQRRCVKAEADSNLFAELGGRL